MSRHVDGELRQSKMLISTSPGSLGKFSISLSRRVLAMMEARESLICQSNVMLTVGRCTDEDCREVRLRCLTDVYWLDSRRLETARVMEI